MKDRISLVDMNFKGLSQQSKRDSFLLLDVVLKRLHEQGIMVTDFDPSTIYFQDGIYFFDKTSPISNYFSDKNEAILRNMLAMADLAFCTYLPDYQLKQGLLSIDVISNHFDDFSSIFHNEDKDYYRSILVDSYSTKSLPNNNIYYADYRNNLNKGTSSMGNANRVSYVKATDAGKAMADKNEAAFGHNFFFITVVASLSIMLIGLVTYFLTYFG